MQPLFTAKRPELIGTIKRNQKQKRRVAMVDTGPSSSSGSAPSLGLPLPEYTIQDRLVQEIRLIQYQQQLLDINVDLFKERQTKEEEKLVFTVKRKFDE